MRGGALEKSLCTLYLYGMSSCSSCIETYIAERISVVPLIMIYCKGWSFSERINRGGALAKSLYVLYGISLHSNSITTLIAEVLFKHKSVSWKCRGLFTREMTSDIIRTFQ